MSKEARALLKKINDMKNAIRGLQGQGKTQEMKDKMDQLREMQQEFDIMMEMDEDEIDDIDDAVKGGKAKGIEGGAAAGAKKYAKADIARAFVNRIVCGLRKRQMTKEDQEIMDAMTEADPNEDGESDGGFTVPQDIQTDIRELRRTENDLEMYVNVENVTTLSGSRVIEIDADSTPWPDVDEGEAFTEQNTPKFKQIKYKVAKKGGILKTTRELLQDTAANILAYLNKWIVAITGVDDLKDVFNVKLDAAIAPTSIVLTNQDGFNYLDKLKDEKKDYIIQPDVTDKTKRLLFGVHPIHVVSNKTLKSVTSGSNAKYPLYMGDLKEAVTLFDREKITVELSTEAGDLWAKDLTGIKVRDRFDVQAVDEAAVIKGEITEAIGG